MSSSRRRGAERVAGCRRGGGARAPPSARAMGNLCGACAGYDAESERSRVLERARGGEGAINYEMSEAMNDTGRKHSTVGALGPPRIHRDRTLDKSKSLEWGATQRMTPLKDCSDEVCPASPLPAGAAGPLSRTRPRSARTLRGMPTPSGVPDAGSCAPALCPPGSRARNETRRCPAAGAPLSPAARARRLRPPSAPRAVRSC